MPVGMPLAESPVSGKVTTTGMRDSANAVAYVEPIPGKTFPAPKKPVVTRAPYTASVRREQLKK